MNAHETNQFARKLVEHELFARGVYAIHTSDNKKKHLIASNILQNRTVTLYVKSKRRGNWHTTTKEGRVTDTIPTDEDTFWVFVEIGITPQFWIVPDWWIRDVLHREHQHYLAEHGGHRPVNDASEHQSVKTEYIKEWEGRWDILRL